MGNDPKLEPIFEKEMLAHIDILRGPQTEVRAAIINGELFAFGDDPLPNLRDVMPKFLANFKQACIKHGENVETCFIPNTPCRTDPLGQYGYIGFKVKK